MSEAPSGTTIGKYSWFHSFIEFETILTQYTSEEEKLINHEIFQAIASKFWALFPKNEHGRITKDSYKEVVDLK